MSDRVERKILSVIVRIDAVGKFGVRICHFHFRLLYKLEHILLLDHPINA